MSAGAQEQEPVVLGIEYLRATFLHVCQCILCHGKHLQDVTAERTLDIVEINILQVLTHHLL